MTKTTNQLATISTTQLATVTGGGALSGMLGNLRTSIRATVQQSLASARSTAASKLASAAPVPAAPTPSVK